MRVRALAKGQNSSVWVCTGARGQGEGEGPKLRSSRSQERTSLNTQNTEHFFALSRRLPDLSVLWQELRAGQGLYVTSACPTSLSDTQLNSEVRFSGEQVTHLMSDLAATESPHHFWKPETRPLKPSATAAHAPWEGAGRLSRRKRSFQAAFPSCVRLVRAPAAAVSTPGVSSGFPRGLVGREMGPAELLQGPARAGEADLGPPRRPSAPHLIVASQLPAALRIHRLNLQGRPGLRIGSRPGLGP